MTTETQFFDTGGGTGFTRVIFKGRRYFVNGDRVSVNYHRPGAFENVSVTRPLSPTSRIAAQVRKIAEQAHGRT